MLPNLISKPAKYNLRTEKKLNAHESFFYEHFPQRYVLNYTHVDIDNTDLGEGFALAR
jgi:hypothetical protein